MTTSKTFENTPILSTVQYFDLNLPSLYGLWCQCGFIAFCFVYPTVIGRIWLVFKFGGQKKS